jgi:hypothetical protein
MSAFSLTGHVGSDTDDWYLHSWIYAEGTSAPKCPMKVLANVDIMVCMGVTDFMISADSIITSITPTGFQPLKWYFIEFGSTNLGYYGSVVQRNGPSYTFAQRLPAIFITETSSIEYPNGSIPNGNSVREK